MITLMCHYMLLAIPGMLPFWIIVFVYVLFICYMYIRILAHYGSIFVSIYGMSILLHSNKIVPKTNRKVFFDAFLINSKFYTSPNYPQVTVSHSFIYINT